MEILEADLQQVLLAGSVTVPFADDETSPEGSDAPDIQNMWRGGEPVGIWDSNYYRKHVYAGFVRGLNGGEPVPTGIDGLEADKTIDISKGIYNLQGIRLAATSLDELPAGLYIVNGKKVIIK